MMIKATGAGGYGSIGGVTGSSSTSRPAAGNSKMLEAKNSAALGAVARSHTQTFISNARKVAQGAAGISRIDIKA